MKKLIPLTFVCSLLLQTSIFASEISDLLDKAKSEYEKGNISESITCIDFARKILDKENLNKTEDEYIEVTNWDVVKLKKDVYIGKKVKFTTRYSGISGSEYIILSGPGACHFDGNLVDKSFQTSHFMELYRIVGQAQLFLLKKSIEG